MWLTRRMFPNSVNICRRSENRLKIHTKTPRIFWITLRQQNLLPLYSSSENILDRTLTTHFTAFFRLQQPPLANTAIFYGENWEEKHRNMQKPVISRAGPGRADFQIKLSNLTLHNYRSAEQLIWLGRVCNKSILSDFWLANQSNWRSISIFRNMAQCQCAKLQYARAFSSISIGLTGSGPLGAKVGPGPGFFFGGNHRSGRPVDITVQNNNTGVWCEVREERLTKETITNHGIEALSL